VNATPAQFYTVPDRPSVEGDAQSLLIDAGSGGGDAFDIADAVKETSPGVPAQPLVYADMPCFHFIRITDALAGDSAGILGEISAEIDAVSCVSPLTGSDHIGTVKELPAGTVVALVGKVVGAVFDGEIYVQEEDRSSGMRVQTTTSVSEGDRVAVIGTLQSAFGAPYLDDARVHVMRGGTPPRPLGMRAADAGGTHQAPTGLLVRVWGSVLSVEGGGFYLADGSQGLKVRCGASALPSEGEFVQVTGAASLEADATSPAPIIRALREGGVAVIAAP